MSLRSLLSAWNRFFFTPQSPVPIALYRTLYGLLITADLVLLHSDWLTWYGTNAFMGMQTLHKVAPKPRLNLFLVMPQDDTWIQAFFWVFLLFSVFLTVGFLSRFSSVVVFVCLASIHQRNIYILHAGDTLLRVVGFFLMFAPTGAAISVDRLWRIWRGREGLGVAPHKPWAQRMIQVQLAFVYFGTFYAKTLGTDWIDGTALYYTSRLAEFRRFPMPPLDGPVMKLATWATLLVEFSMGVLVWFRELRYWILLLGLCLHLGIEYSMNVPLFQWIIMATYVTFVDPTDLNRVWGRLRDGLGAQLGEPAEMIYDARSTGSVRLANLLGVLDVFRRLRITEFRAAGFEADAPDLPVEQVRLLVRAHGSLYQGYRALQTISRLIPMLWPLAPLSFLFGQSRRLLKTANVAR